MALVPKPRTLLVAGLLAILVVLALSLRARAEPMVATYYGDEYVGAPTASGEPYNPYGYTAAHPYLPLGTELLVSYDGRSAVVRVNDSCLCGLDLSLAAAQEIGLIDAGVAVVDAEVLSTQPLPMAPLPADVAPGLETPQASDAPLTVEDQAGSTVAPQVEAPPTPPTDYSELTSPW